MITHKKALVFFSAVSISGSLLVAEPTGRYKVILDRLDQLHAKYTDISSIFSIGKNGEGTDIYAIRVSLTPTEVDKQKIGHFMVSTHHGNESAAPLFTMRFIEDLLDRYASSELWRGQLAEIEWTIIPVLNISGYNLNQRHEYGLDPNRDYPSPCTSHPGGKLKSIATLLNFLSTRIFSGSVTVHGYHGSLTYPWGMFLDKYETLDDNLFHQITKNAAEFNGYEVGTASAVVYPANGCYEDFGYYKYGMWSLLLELRSGTSADIDATVKAIAKYYEQLNSSPSSNNQLTAHCTRKRLPDLRME